MTKKFSLLMKSSLTVLCKLFNKWKLQAETRKSGVYFRFTWSAEWSWPFFLPLLYLTNNPSYCLLFSIEVQLIKLKKKWSLFINFVNLKHWEGNYEIYYCAYTYETVTHFFLYFFNLWLNLLIILLFKSQPLLNGVKQLLIINVYKV